MKIKVLISLIVVVVVGYLVYSYVYKEHRDIDKEESLAISSVVEVIAEFKTDENQASRKYLDKVIQIKGVVTEIDQQQQTLTIDRGLFSSFQELDTKSIKLGQTITAKGRLIGYDELLEELKMDNCIIVE